MKTLIYSKPKQRITTSFCPQKFFITAASSYGETELNAFDNALLSSRVANYNLVKVTSIIPPFAYESPLDLKPGSILPIAYAKLTSSKKGTLITAAIGVALPEDGREVGVIMEFSGNLPKEEAEAKVRMMVNEAMQAREIRVGKIATRAASVVVDKPAAVFAGVALW